MSILKGCVCSFVAAQMNMGQQFCTLWRNVFEVKCMGEIKEWDEDCGLVYFCAVRLHGGCTEEEDERRSMQ